MRKQISKSERDKTTWNLEVSTLIVMILGDTLTATMKIPVIQVDVFTSRVPQGRDRSVKSWYLLENLALFRNRAVDDCVLKMSAPD